MGHRILLCDDEVHILKAAEIKLSRAGYEVTTAADGEEGWESIQAQMPDFVITDCQMPRLNGLGLAKRIREHAATAHLPIILLTAKGYELSITQVQQELGILTIVDKPFSPKQLTAMVDEVLKPVPQPS